MNKIIILFFILSSLQSIAETEDSLISGQKGYTEIYESIISYVNDLNKTTLIVIRNQLRITKGSTVANFRVKWIDDFRTIIAELQTALDNIALKKMDKFVYFGTSHYAIEPDYVKARYSLNKIKLMFDTSMPYNKKYLDHLEKYIDNHLKYYGESKSRKGC